MLKQGLLSGSNLTPFDEKQSSGSIALRRRRGKGHVCVEKAAARAPCPAGAWSQPAQRNDGSQWFPPADGCDGCRSPSCFFQASQAWRSGLRPSRKKKTPARGPLSPHLRRWTGEIIRLEVAGAPACSSTLLTPGSMRPSKDLPRQPRQPAAGRFRWQAGGFSSRLSCSSGPTYDRAGPR